MHAQSCLTLCNPLNCNTQAPLSMEFSRQEYWTGLRFPASGDLSDPGMEPTSPMSPALKADSLPAEPSGKKSISKGCCGPEDIRDTLRAEKLLNEALSLKVGP